MTKIFSADVLPRTAAKIQEVLLPLRGEGAVPSYGSSYGTTSTTSTDSANDAVAGEKLVTPPPRSPVAGKEDTATAGTSFFSPSSSYEEGSWSIDGRKHLRMKDVRLFDGKSTSSASSITFDAKSPTSSSTSLDGKWTSSPASSTTGEDDDDPELGGAPRAWATVEVESSGGSSDSQEDNLIFAAGGVGRARLWRQMLVGAGKELRASFSYSSMLDTIVEENARTLDQGLVLPCAPTDEEKVCMMYVQREECV